MQVDWLGREDSNREPSAYGIRTRVTGGRGEPLIRNQQLTGSVRGFEHELESPIDRIAPRAEALEAIDDLVIRFERIILADLVGADPQKQITRCIAALDAWIAHRQLMQSGFDQAAGP
jgi:hypothetical protein